MFAQTLLAIPKLPTKRALSYGIFVLVCLGFAMAIWRLVTGYVVPITLNTAALTQAEYDVLSAQLPDHDRLFLADIRAMQATLSAPSWVKEAHVYKDALLGIRANVVPRRAIARYGTTALVDMDGTLFEPLVPTDARLVNLQGSAEDLPTMMRLTAKINRWYAPLGIEVSDLILTHRQTWIVRFDNNMSILVDKEQTDAKLSGLSKILTNQLAHRAIASVDLRYKSGFAVVFEDIP